MEDGDEINGSTHTLRPLMRNPRRDFAACCVVLAEKIVYLLRDECHKVCGA